MRGLALAVLMGVAVFTAILGAPATAGDLATASPTAGNLATASPTLLPVVPKASGTCVEEPAVMRRNHMDFLAHQRDATLRQGIRGAKHSLKECVTCHVQTGQNGILLPVNAERQFCESCHAYAAVSVDCFQCHATVPGGTRPGNVSATAGR